MSGVATYLRIAGGGIPFIGAELDVHRRRIPDVDDDGIADASDNCVLQANADQRDTNDDGFGNVCDADLNDDGVVNFIDLGLLRAAFFSDEDDADFNGDNQVNAGDLGTMRVMFFGAPGPSGLISP